MKKEREFLLKKLLTTNHLNVPERKLLDDTPTFFELLEVATNHFKNNSFLPSDLQDWDDSKLCYEGYCLEKTDISPTRFILHLQVAGPTLTRYANQKFRFDSIERALFTYLQKEFNFMIDGIQIKHDKQLLL